MTPREVSFATGVESGVDAPGGLVGQALAIELGAKQPAVFLEIGVESLNVSGGQLVQLDTAQGGNDVLVDPPLIGHLGVGPEVRFFIGLVPVLQPSAQGKPCLGNFRGGSFQSLTQGLQLCHTFRFRLSKDILGHREALFIVAHHIPTLPAAILSQADAAVAVFSAFCHGAISSPK